MKLLPDDPMGILIFFSCREILRRECVKNFGSTAETVNTEPLKKKTKRYL